jgi:hypothetical protein
MLADRRFCPKKKLVLGVSQLLVLGRAEEKLIREDSRDLIPLLLVKHAPGFELGTKVLLWEGRIGSGALILLLVRSRQLFKCAVDTYTRHGRFFDKQAPAIANPLLLMLNRLNGLGL